VPFPSATTNGWVSCAFQINCALFRRWLQNDIISLLVFKRSKSQKAQN